MRAFSGWLEKKTGEKVELMADKDVADIAAEDATHEEKKPEHVQFTEETKLWSPEHQRGRSPPPVDSSLKLSLITKSKSRSTSRTPSECETDEGYLSSSSPTKRKNLSRLLTPLAQTPDSAVSPGTSKAKALFRARVAANIDITTLDNNPDSLPPQYFFSPASAHLIQVPKKITENGNQSPDKPLLSIVIPHVPQTTEPRKRSAPRRLSLSDKPVKKSQSQSHSLPSSPFILVSSIPPGGDEEVLVETPTSILSSLEPALIPVSLRRGLEHDSDDDDAYLSDPGTSMPDSAYTPISLPSPVEAKVYPAIQRGREVPFPVKSIRRGRQVPFPLKPVLSRPLSIVPNVSEADPKEIKETMAARLALLRSRYHDIKLASPTEQNAIKTSLMSPTLKERPAFSFFVTS